MYGLGGFKLNDFKAKSAAQGAQKYIYNSLPRYLFCLGLLERKVEFIQFFQIDQGKTASAARNWIEFFPPNRSDNVYLCFCPHPSSMVLSYPCSWKEDYVCDDLWECLRSGNACTSHGWQHSWQWPLKQGFVIVNSSINVLHAVYSTRAEWLRTFLRFSTQTHIRKSVCFQKIAGTFKINIFVENFQ